MINLIPPHGQTALKHEYFLRVLTVYGFLWGGVLVASSALMAPTYILTNSQLNAARSDSVYINETKAAFDAAFGEINIANKTIAQLRVGEEQAPYSMLIEEVVRVAPRGITFSTFQGAYVDGRLDDIQVQGVSGDRKALSDFKDALEASPLFAKAVVPISDLARDANLSFVVTIMLEKEVITP